MTRFQLIFAAAVAAIACVPTSGALAKSHKHKRHSVDCALTNVYGDLIGSNQFGNGGMPTYSLTINCAGNRHHAGRFTQFTVTSTERIQAPKSGRSVPDTPCTVTGPFTYSCTLSAGQSADTADTLFTSPDECRSTPFSGTVQVQAVSDGAGGHKTVTIPFSSTMCQISGLPGS